MSEYIQIAAIRGHNCINDTRMYMDDFYTVVMKEPIKNIGIRKKSPYKHGEIIFRTENVDIDYLYSDFLRFCLSFFKNNSNLVCGEALSMIPKQPIPISKELKEYIESFLPDYYGIR